MIDDNPKVSKYLADNGVKVLLFDAPYNKNLRHPNIKRVYSWDEIAKAIETE